METVIKPYTKMCISVFQWKILASWCIFPSFQKIHNSFRYWNAPMQDTTFFEIVVHALNIERWSSSKVSSVGFDVIQSYCWINNKEIWTFWKEKIQRLYRENTSFGRGGGYWNNSLWANFLFTVGRQVAVCHTVFLTFQNMNHSCNFILWSNFSASPTTIFIVTFFLLLIGQKDRNSGCDWFIQLSVNRCAITVFSFPKLAINYFAVRSR